MKKKYILLGIILLCLSTIFIVGKYVLSNETHADPDTTQDYTLTIKQETEENEEGKFTYRIKAWKDNIDEEAIYIGYVGETACAGRPRGDEGAPTFYPYVTFSYNGYIYDDYSYSGPFVDTYGNKFESPGGNTQEYFELSSALKNSTYTLTDKYVHRSSFNYLEIYKTNIEITYNNTKYILYTNFDYFEDEFTGMEYVEEVMFDLDYQLFIFDRDESTDNLDFSVQFGTPGEEGYYTFALSNNDTKTIQIPKGYEYEIEQLTTDGWQLASINGSEEPVNTSGTIEDDIEYTFLNKKTESEPEVPIVEPEVPQEPEPTEPTPSEPTSPVKEDKPNTPKTENIVKRSATPNTVDKIIIDSELLVISVLVMGICVMLIKRIR